MAILFFGNNVVVYGHVHTVDWRVCGLYRFLFLLVRLRVRFLQCQHGLILYVGLLGDFLILIVVPLMREEFYPDDCCVQWDVVFLCLVDIRR